MTEKDINALKRKTGTDGDHGGAEIAALICEYFLIKLSI
jgi:hypothetical protein